MFTDWLLKQLRKENWSQADLARASGLTTAAISKYVSGRIPDKDALREIARAFKLPPETVFRAAGILPQQSEESELSKELQYFVEQLPMEIQEEVLEYVKMRFNLAEERGKYETKRPKKTTTTK